MHYVITTATKKLSQLRRRLRCVPGGTSAGKTIGILEILIDLAQTDARPTLTSVVSESFPHLKRGAIKDFLDIMKAQGYYREDRWNKTDYTYEFETGSKVEFFSADQPSKVRGPRRDRLFINEANNVPLETFEQLEIRTREFVFLDWNPTTEFWYYTEVQGKRDDVDELTLTYKDNEALDSAIVGSIEQRRDRREWWKVYGEGKLGETESRIYKDWEMVDDVPQEARLERYGLDFGYTNDPTAIVAVYYHNGGYVIDEVAYQTGLLNGQIAGILQNQERQAITIADSAEPKSIDELRTHKLTVLPAKKGQGSVAQMISWVQQQRISVTKRSLNVIREYRNYVWETDKDGKITNEPETMYKHSMDAIAYALSSIKDPQRMTAHVHYAESALPTQNIPQTQRPRYAHTHVPGSALQSNHSRR